MSTSQQPRSESGDTTAGGSGTTAGATSEPAAGPGYSGAAAAETAPAAAGEDQTGGEQAEEVKLGPTGRPLREIPEPPELHTHGPATVLAMCNQKGGVGKTTSTINLGAALAEYGRRVLLVDFDPQGALSVGLGVQPHELEQSVYNVIMERSLPVDSVIRNTKLEGIDLLPSNIDLSAAEVQLVAEVGREHTLLRVLHPVMKQYDYVLVDCQPSLGLLTVNALTASDGVIIPLECEFFSLRGVALLIDTIDKVRERLNPKLDITGILATMFDPRTLHSKEVMARVVEAFGDTVFDTVINRTVRFPETTVAGEPITKWAPRSAGAAAYRQLAREVIGR
ncbi:MULTISPECIES: ParA family protein [Prauserella salsuginis group]|uniref:Chromosome partitioning protein n=2 Tax=Prauserella salsuginis group TaxID=2893672 RepID=A0A839XW92_9PSEU|nr:MULTISPECIES: ParA family protein [Prauserella salsuginis group]MBB3665328.1 chromosome partitioning protein [Prauserella sediminis]MCR3723037.1 chromosome partitioning protein [Prauserella flava]MCR3732588.1 chromosome partitioning protein [Prauserella salsuginis]